MLLEPYVRSKYTTAQILEFIESTKGNARAISRLLGEKESTVRDWLLTEPLLAEARDKVRGKERTFAVSVTSRPKEYTSTPSYKDLRPLHEQPLLTQPRPTYGAINDRILVISDTHAPYHHLDTLDFLAALHAKYGFTRIIHIGDEVDNHSFSYHEHDPDLLSPRDELHQARVFLHALQRIFPIMDIMKSNHGDLPERKMRTIGLPAELLVSRAAMYMIGDGWLWHDDLTLMLPTGYGCLFTHGALKNAVNASKDAGCSLVQGHYHTEFEIRTRRTSDALHFGMSVGCLIDRNSPAMQYAYKNIKKQIIGCGMIIDGLPMLAPMCLNSEGRWTGAIP